MEQMPQYTKSHAQSGLKARLPKLECFPNQYDSGYEVTIEIPEFTSMCPKTGLPDFGFVSTDYVPQKWCVELKALKYYINGYRDVGIFQENVVNRILKDFVAAVKPRSALVRGEFNARGGLKTTVEASYPRRKR